MLDRIRYPRFRRQRWTLLGAHRAMLKLSLSNVGVTLPLLPSGRLCTAVPEHAEPDAMLPALRPVALVPTAVGPREDTEAVLAVEKVLTCVLPTIGPHVSAEPMNHRVLPIPFVPTSVVSKVRALAIDGVTMPRALILGAIGPAIEAKALLLAVFEAALKPRALGPCLHTDALLQVVVPLALVGGEVSVAVRAETVRNVVPPQANVGVPVAVSEPALTLGLVLPPLALVFGSVGPSLAAKAVPQIAAPLAGVHGTRRKPYRFPILNGACKQALQNLRGLAVKIARRLGLLRIGWLLHLLGLPHRAFLGATTLRCPRIKGRLLKDPHVLGSIFGATSIGARSLPHLLRYFSRSARSGLLPEATKGHHEPK
mmetsp:Transcript_59313/g.153250  ORF Transcript_59313/g.153250 Transcript_59313/m.153250 type:complete len:369 (+) Transcript_59313:3-1109(+)